MTDSSIRIFVALEHSLQVDDGVVIVDETNFVTEIEHLVSAWANAWNHHDVEAAAALVVPEVDFVNVLGRWLQGKEEFVEHHRQLHSRQMRNSDAAAV